MVTMTTAHWLLPPRFVFFSFNLLTCVHVNKNLPSDWKLKSGSVGSEPVSRVSIYLVVCCRVTAAAAWNTQNMLGNSNLSKVFNYSEEKLNKNSDKRTEMKKFSWSLNSRVLIYRHGVEKQHASVVHTPSHNEPLLSPARCQRHVCVMCI